MMSARGKLLASRRVGGFETGRALPPVERRFPPAKQGWGRCCAEPLSDATPCFQAQRGN